MIKHFRIPVAAFDMIQNQAFLQQRFTIVGRNSKTLGILIPGISGPLVASAGGCIKEQQRVFAESGDICMILPSASGINCSELLDT